MTDVRRLIINADDFGLSPGINRGIIAAYLAGTVTSTSLLATTAGFDDAIDRLRGARGLPVGLHFSLTLGCPLSDGASLRDGRSGRFSSIRAMLARLVTGRLSLPEVRAECDAQIQRLTHAGIAIDHIDSHHHVHALPGIADAVLASARSHGLEAARIRVPVDTSSEPLSSWRSRVKAIVIGASWRFAARGKWPPVASAHFRGISLYGDPRFAAHLRELLDALPEGETELMVHPGYADDVLASLDPYTWQREGELRTLLSTGLQARLRRGDLALARGDHGRNEPWPEQLALHNDPHDRVRNGFESSETENQESGS
jgi:predicted glycoside hydrolase/deacetylase ChbG (UPF0249 family)